MKKLLFLSIQLLISIITIGQVNNTISNIAIKAPCKMQIVFSEPSVVSYSCSNKDSNDNPLSYRATVESSSHIYTVEELYNEVKKPPTTALNIKYVSIGNIRAVQYEEPTPGYMDFKARIVVFTYKKQLYSLSLISNTVDYESKFKTFLSNISFK